MKFACFASECAALFLACTVASAQDSLMVAVAAVSDTVTIISSEVADTVTAAVADSSVVAASAPVAPVGVADTTASAAVADSSVVAASTPAAVVAPASVVTAAEEPYSGSFLLANDLQTPMVNFEGKGGLQTVKVRSSTGWWYLDGSIPWCEIKNVTDSSFTLRCNVNSVPLARHSYIRVKTEGVEDATVAVVQASLPDNFLSVGAWRDSLKNCREFDCGGRTLVVSDNETGFEDCPGGWFYVGDVVRGRKTGHGCCYDRYGNLIYSGEFYKDIPAGEFPSRDGYSDYKFECQKFSNGTIYFGETKCGLRHGYGIFMSPDGSLWFGRWKKGQQIVSEGVAVTLTSASSDYDL